MGQRIVQALTGVLLCIGLELFGAPMEGQQPLSSDQLLRLGSEKLNEGNYIESEGYLRKAVAASSTSGDASINVRARVDLAAVLFLGSRGEEAEELLKGVLKTLQSGRNADASYLTVVLINLGAVYRLNGQYENSEAVLNQAKLRMDASHDKRREVDLLSNLGVLYAVTGRRKLALSVLKEAVALEDQIGQDPIYVARTLINLATIYHLEKKWAAAEPILIRAQQSLEHSVGPLHPELASILNNLGFVYMAQKDFARAEAVLRRAHNIRTRVFGPDNIGVASVAMRLADALTEQGKFEEAATLYENALRVHERVVGSRSTDVAETLEHFSRMLRLKTERDVDAMETRAKSIRRQQELLVSVKK
jgi:tetratricopeptide (TPR) repeat protein